MKRFLRYRLERLAVWALERCLAQQAFVLTREFKKLTDRAEAFEKEVKEVEGLYRNAVLKLDQRVSKLEGR